MPWIRPTLKELTDRIEDDLTSRLTGEASLLRRSVLGVFSRVWGGVAHLMHGFLEWISRQVFPDIAEAEFMTRWASVWGVDRKTAVYASGDVTFTGNNGAVIPAGTKVQRSDAALFTTLAEGVISGGVVDISVEADEAGDKGNTVAGASMTLTSPIVEVNSSAVVASGGIVNGADEEADESLRTRLVSRIQQPPHGGADFDYDEWALEVSGVTRAWIYPAHMGLGTVGVTFVLDGETNIIPDAAKVAEVQSYIEAERPVTAEVYVFAPSAVPLNPEISVTPNTSAVQAAVQTQIENLILREAEPGKTLLLSHINEAISIAAGETDHTLISPTADVTHSTGEMAVMGTITWS